LCKMRVVARELREHEHFIALKKRNMNDHNARGMPMIVH